MPRRSLPPVLLFVVLCCWQPARVGGHGTLNLPPSRNNALSSTPGLVNGGKGGEGRAAFYFSDDTHIPGNATLTGGAGGQCKMLTMCDCSNCSDAQCREAACGGAVGASDYPWRAPGTAPLTGGPCGAIGWDTGAPGLTPGTDLPPNPQPPEWRIGGVVEVAFGLHVNHGGGYSYRLCKKNDRQSPTEECFQRTPLAFVGATSDIVDLNGTRLYTIPATRTTEGTVPPGSEWTKNPVPYNTSGAPPPYNTATAPFFPPPFPGGYGQDCSAEHPEVNGPGCEGDGWAWSIMDRVRVPATLPPGSYVLGWRWDCEMNPQVWNNCADVRLVQ